MTRERCTPSFKEDACIDKSAPMHSLTRDAWGSFFKSFADVAVPPGARSCLALVAVWRWGWPSLNRRVVNCGT